MQATGARSDARLRVHARSAVPPIANQPKSSYSASHFRATFAELSCASGPQRLLQAFGHNLERKACTEQLVRMPFSSDPACWYRTRGERTRARAHTRFAYADVFALLTAVVAPPACRSFTFAHTHPCTHNGGPKHAHRSHACTHPALLSCSVALALIVLIVSSTL
jgi:hypothetical protein